MKDVEYRKALQNRTVEPSADSWEKLSKRLTAQEDKEQRKSRSYFMYAALILALISLGVYLSQPGDEIIDAPEIAAPAIKDPVQPDPVGKDDPKTEMATVPNNSPPVETDRKEDPVRPERMEAEEQQVAYSTKELESDLSDIKLEEQLVSDSLTPPSSLAAQDLSTVRSIEDEVDRLLNNSRINLGPNGRVAGGKVVSADDLLNEIEDDLDKDLKQRLFEKIVKTIKNPKEVITYQEN